MNNISSPYCIKEKKNAAAVQPAIPCVRKER